MDSGKLSGGRIDCYYMEDDAAIASAVKTYLEGKGCQVSVLPTVAEARRALEKRLPAVVLLDWSMPDGSGDALCRWMRARWKELPILFLTVKGDAGEVVRGFQCGADDYVTKPFDLEILYSRIRAILRRAGEGAGDTLSCGGITVDQRRAVVTLEAEEVPLSPLEYQLLLFLMRNKGRTVTRSQLLERLWDENGNFVNDNTLTVAMKRLREKLGRPACLKTVRSIGYRLEDAV